MALEADLSCPVCTEVFSHPVLLSCGHSFCRQCINDHWTSSISRNCPVCRQISPQEPVSNLSLRNTCESYLRVQNTNKERDGEHVCQIHGELIELFCQTDEQTICATCKKQRHKRHKTQQLQLAVRQRKGKLKAAVRPAEKMLSLQNGTAQDGKVCYYNQVCVCVCVFSAKYILSDPELSSEALDVPKHLGNLKYQVWEKMKDICLYYPVILNPNTASADISVSDDLTSVTSCLRWQDEPNPFPLHSNRIVLGSVGYGIGTHTWEIEVGNSRHWSLGVCFGLEGKPITEPLTPANGFWGLRRDGDSYETMTTGMSRLNTNVNPEVVRVKLEDYVDDTLEKKRWRKEKLKGALRPAEKTLWSLQNAAAQDAKICNYNQNYNSIMNRAKYTLPDQESSETLVDVSKHLGNLKYQVWYNMKDICPYYPVILNPHTTPADFSVSDDLTSVTSCLHRQEKSNAFPLNRSRMVLGSVGYGIGTHTWQIEVGNSHHWILGVCFRSEGKPITQPLSPENGFWGLRRDGCMYSFLNMPTRFTLKTNPAVVQVRLEDDYDVMGRWQRKVSFSDAGIYSQFAKISGVPSGKELFPFVMPEDQSIPLRVVPVPAKITLAGEQVERNLSFKERYKGLIESRGNSKRKRQESQSPEPSGVSVKSSRSMEAPVRFSDGKQISDPLISKRKRQESESPEPSGVSVKSSRFMEAPVRFSNGKEISDSLLV
ncbi:tripartite motif-containing 35-like protein [Labeo rohita]|uniref:Tripartite motif-containing 35-like protein n=1 Tax=Labeo rohita TaxID=84645 RepID=A0A498LW20_LABRO|nr:tripartite motif-containing 35-like protein [Labeo rohita]